MNIHTLPTIEAGVAPADWRARNDAVIALGLDWVGRRLAGEDGDQARAAFDAARTAMIAAGDPAAIDRLSAVCALSAFAEDVLLIALGAEIDGGLARQYGRHCDRAGPVAATPRLIALLLFGGERLPSIAFDALAVDALLRRLVLVDWGTASTAIDTPITLPPRVRDYLCGRDVPPADCRPHALVPLPARLKAMASQIASTMSSAPLASQRLQLLGPRRSGRRALAIAVLDVCGLGALFVERAEADGGTLARECLLGQCGLVLTGDADPTSFADWPTPVIVIAPDTRDAAIPFVRLPALSSADALEIWPGDAAALADLFALAPHEIATVAALPAPMRAAAAREIGARDLGALAARIIPARRWDDMVLAPQVAADLAVLSAMVGHRALVHRGWGYGGLLGQASGVTALFAGPSGVGKTMAAEAIAADLGLDLFTIDLSRIASKYIGETEKNLAQLFDAAQVGGCVLFFDEADALFGKRSEVKDSHDRYANAEISYLLQRMERFSGLAILATNLKSHLDTAFLRRIRMVIDFPLPDHDARLALWHRALPGSAPLGDIDWTALARADLSPANILTIASGAAFRAAQCGGRIGMAELHAAMAAEYRKLDRDPAGLMP